MYLAGSDVIESILNPETLSTTYKIKTDWRKIRVNLTDNFILDFIKYFQPPISEWQLVNYPVNGELRQTFFYNYTELTTFDPTCHFILPVNVFNIETNGVIPDPPAINTKSFP